MKEFFLRLIPKRYKTSYIDAIIFILSVIVASFIGVLVLFLIDTIPATDLDYEPLLGQATMLENSPEMLTATNCTLYSKDGLLTVTFENDECKLITKYDSNLNLLEITRDDKCVHWLLALVVAIILMVGAYAYCHIIFFFLLCLIDVLWRKIFKKK